MTDSRAEQSRQFYHVAPVLGKPTVFASIEYPRDKPPAELVIDGIVWRRADYVELDAPANNERKEQ